MPNKEPDAGGFGALRPPPKSEVAGLEASSGLAIVYALGAASGSLTPPKVPPEIGLNRGSAGFDPPKSPVVGAAAGVTLSSETPAKVPPDAGLKIVESLPKRFFVGPVVSVVFLSAATSFAASVAVAVLAGAAVEDD